MSPVCEISFTKLKGIAVQGIFCLLILCFENISFFLALAASIRTVTYQHLLKSASVQHMYQKQITFSAPNIYLFLQSYCCAMPTMRAMTYTLKHSIYVTMSLLIYIMTSYKVIFDKILFKNFNELLC